MTVSPIDRAALSDLVARYALNIDQRNLAVVAGLFTADAVLVMPEPPASLLPTIVHEGRDAVMTALSAVEQVPQTFHAILGEVYDVGAEPGRVRGTVACAAHHFLQRSSGEPIDRVWHLRYQDTYRQEAGAWRFARRELHVASIAVAPVRSWLGAGQA